MPVVQATLLPDTSPTADVNGNKVLEIRYREASRAALWRVDKACPLRYTAGVLREGEVRASWTANPTTTPAYKSPAYTYTGQYSYMDDPTTSGIEGFGLMFYNARWYDPYITQFSQPDSIVPLASQGTQAWDRYAYSNNNPIRYNDPSGHGTECGIGESCRVVYTVIGEIKYLMANDSVRYRQRAIEMVMDYYNIGTAKFINGKPTYDPALDEKYGDGTLGNTNPDGTVEIGADAFSSPGRLASVIAHEGVHSLQAKEGRYYDRSDPLSFLNEIEANDYVLGTADNYGLTESEVKEIMDERDFANISTRGNDYGKRIEQGIYTKIGENTGSRIWDWFGDHPGERCADVFCN